MVLRTTAMYAMIMDYPPPPNTHFPLPLPVPLRSPCPPFLLCRTAVDYAAAYGRLDTLSCLIAFGCEISDQTVTTLLSGDLAVGAAAFNRCIWKGITTARYHVFSLLGEIDDLQ